MSIRRGSKEELGNIKYLGPCHESDGSFYTDTNHQEDLLGVFWKDRLIWPTQSRYQFWVTNTYFARQSISDNTLYLNNVEPCSTDITIYMRSCTRFYDKKYDVNVSCSSSWISIDGNPSIENNQVVENRIICNTDQSKEDIPDGKFIINIGMNPSPFSRTTTLICTQINDLQEDAPTGKQFRIVINQKGDYPVEGTEDFSKSEITWYDSEDFLHKVTSYGSIDKGIVPISGGTFKTYFSISVKTKMKSGIYSSRLYGTLGNESTAINIKDFTSSDPDNMYVTDVAYNGNGGWIATCYCKSNDNKNNAPVMAIKDLMASPENVDYLGGSITLSWYVYATLTTSPKIFSLSVSIPERVDPLTPISCFEDGGSITNKTKLTNSHVVIPSTASSWISLDGSLSVDNDLKHYQKVTLNAQSRSSKMYIENFLMSYDDIIPYDSDSVTFSFEIYRKDNTYLERIGNLIVVAGNASENIKITQYGKDGNNHVEVDGSMLASSEISAYMANPEDDSYYSEFLSNFRNVRYYRYKWRIDATVAKNLQQVIDKGIYLISYNQYVSENSHDETFTWTIKSGVANSIERHAIIEIDIPKYSCEHKEEISQEGSSLPEKIMYDDMATCAIINKTDNTTGTVTIDKSNHVYTGKVLVKKNNTRIDNTIAYVVPSSVEESYNTILDNNSISAIYLKVNGHPSYKGTIRNVSISISATNLAEKKATIVQKENTIVVDESSNVPAIGLNDDWFSLTEDSEGSIYGKSILVSEEVGLYMIPIYVKENNEATFVDCCIEFDGKEYKSSQSVTLPSIYDKELFSVSGWWKKYGIPIDRHVTLVVKDLTSIKFTWSNVRYSGEMYVHNIINDAYKISAQVGKDWMFMSSSNNLTVMSNNSGIRRSGNLTLSFYDDSKKIKDIVLSLVQDPNATVGDYEFSSLYTGQWIEMSSSNTTEFSVSSYDKYDRKYMYTKEEYNTDLITLTKTYSNSGLISYKVKVKTNNISDVTRCPIRIKQYDRTGNLHTGEITINLYIPYYLLSVDKKSLSISLKNDKATINVNSIKKIVTNNGVSNEKVRYTLSMTNNDLIVMNQVNNQIMLTCVGQNKEISEQTITVKVEQDYSNSITVVKIYVPSWRDSQYDYSDIHLYNDKDSKDVLFFSMENDTQLQPSVKLLTGSLPNKNNPEVISTKISQYGDQWKVTFKANKNIDGEMYEYGYFEVYNKNFTLGRNRVYLHSFIFSASSETNDGTYEWYLSANSGDLWSLYYIYSKQDGNDIDFEISEASDDLSLTRNKNAIEIIPIYDNNENYRKEYILKLIQQNSNKVLSIKLIQLTKDDMKGME